MIEISWVQLPYHVQKTFLTADVLAGPVVLRKFLLPSSILITETEVKGLCCRYINWAWEPHSQLFFEFSAVVDFCGGLCLLQNESSLDRDESYTYLWQG